MDVRTFAPATRFFVLSAVFLISTALRAQQPKIVAEPSLPSATSSAAASIPPPSAAAGVFPLSEVHRGLHGVAYTVFEGTKPEPMDLEILGILKNALGPHHDMILARLEGAKPEYTGVVAGMSGSPVYVDGRLLGALSYRIGEFSKEPIAGITPIAEMLDVSNQSMPLSTAQLRDAGASLSFAGNREPATSEQQGREDSSTTAVSAGSEIHPIETPLVFSGFSPEAVRLFGDRFRIQGLTPVAGLGGSEMADTAAAPSGKEQGISDPLEPGSAVSALLVKGDMEISATCTVTYVDPHRVLACGHPITQFGEISVPMAKAEVVATLASPLNAFKIINTAQTIGAFTEDRASAIYGLLGKSAEMIPLSIHLHGGSGERTIHLEVVDNPDITPGAIMVSLYQSLMESNSYGVELTYALRGTVTVDGYPDLHLSSLVAPTDEIPAAVRAALTLGQSFVKIYGNSARLGRVHSIDLDVDTLAGHRSTELQTAHTAEPSAHAGDTVLVEATLRPFQGEARNLRIPILLPQTLSPGPLRILISDGETLDRLTSNNPAVDDHSDLSSVIHQLNSTHANDRLYVSLLLPDVQAVVDGRTLPSLPISMANVLAPLRDNRQMSLNGESVVPVTSIPVDAMLSGQQVVSLNIE
jgi:SpoIVB peptidase S55